MFSYNFSFCYLLKDKTSLNDTIINSNNIVTIYLNNASPVEGDFSPFSSVLSSVSSDIFSKEFFGLTSVFSSGDSGTTGASSVFSSGLLSGAFGA